MKIKFTILGYTLFSLLAIDTLLFLNSRSCQHATFTLIIAMIIIGIIITCILWDDKNDNGIYKENKPAVQKTKNTYSKSIDNIMKPSYENYFNRAITLGDLKRVVENFNYNDETKVLFFDKDNNIIEVITMEKAAVFIKNEVKDCLRIKLV
jgi:hypothetical protein